MRLVLCLAAAALAACSSAYTSAGEADAAGSPSTPDPTTPETPMTSTTEGLYQFDSKTLDGQPKDLAAFAGKPVLIVNTASKCGLTPQYKDLQKLHETYGDRGLVVLGFPCNQFMGQEPGSAEDIAAFCEANYGVTFQMMEKVAVKEDGQDPVYAWLEEQTGEVPDWNFAKYLVAPDGKRVTFFGARTEPLGDELTGAIESALEG